MSARAVTDREAVLRTMAEHDRLGRDAFLERYGFDRGGNRYEVAHNGKHYHAAAIIAVAHREQHGRVLKPEETKGAHEVLAGLGFEVFKRLPAWTEDETVLALDAYFRRRHVRASKADDDVKALSRMLLELAAQQGRKHGKNFRNESGVAQQLGKFLNCEQTSEPSPKRGRGRPSKIYQTIWERYASDPMALAQRAAEIRKSMGPEWSRSSGRTYEYAFPPGNAYSNAQDAPRLHPRVASLDEVSAPFDAEAIPELPEAAEPSRPDPEAQLRANAMHRELRRELAERLQAEGFTCRNSQTTRTDLRYDLLAIRGDLTLLVEVKSLPPGGNDHDQLRRGLGQILWYRGRWRDVRQELCVAVLYIERKPADESTWLKVCESANVVLAWPDQIGTLLEQCAKRSAGVRWRYSQET